MGELGGIIGALDEQQADLQALIEEKKLELKNLDDSVSDNKRQELIKLDEKISSLKENETKTVNEFEKRIGELSLKEKSLRDSINLKNKELEEIENNIQKKGSHQTSTNEDNLISLIVEEQNLADSITKKRHYLEEMEMKISSLKDDEQMLKASVEAGKKEIGEIGSINGNSINLQNSISLLKEEEGELRGKLDLLNQAEQIKKELISELNDKLSANEINFAALEKDYEEKTNQLEKTTLKLRKITGESTYKQKELLTLAQVVDDKTKTLKNLAAEISFSEVKINSLKKETIKIENLQTEAEQKY